MPQFAYRAKKGPHDVLTGVIDAATQEEVINQLSDQGLLPVSIEELKEGAKAPPVKTAAAAPATVSAASPRLFFGRVKSSEITIFSRQMSSLLKSGVPILRALWIISEQSENPRFKKVMAHAEKEIKEGKQLSSVLSQYPKLFPPIYIAMVRTGEDSGTLHETLLRISDYRQKQEAVVSHVRTAMAYPVLMALTGVGTVIFLLSFVVPRLTALFANMGAALPLPTRILITASRLFHDKIFLAVLAVSVLSLISLLRLRAEQAKRLWSRVSLRIPFIKDFILKVELGRFARTLYLLIKSGIPIIKSIEITIPVLDNFILREEFARTRDELSQGGLLGKSLRQSKYIPLFMTNLISVGEESGKLEEAMDEIANFYERETDESVKVLTSLLEPLMILAMGLVVGFIVIAMLLPMFELNLAVK